MDSDQILRTVDIIHREKKIAKELIFSALEKALEHALRKRVGEKAEVQVRIDRESGDTDALVDGEPVEPEELGRIPAQTAKQVLIQKLREAEGDVVFEEFNGREGELVSGSVSRVEGGSLIVGLTASAEGILPRKEQIPGEHFRIGDRVRAIITKVEKKGQKVNIILSRTHPDIVRRLFEIEIPEIGEKLIEVKALVREPGERTKLAVASYDAKIDCVGACVGVRGSRIKGIIDEFNGEKIDIIRWNESPEVYITNALKPAQISRITLFEDQRRAVAVVPEEQLSLAIGRKGQNVRLAARLVDWSIDIQSEAQERAQMLRQKAEFLQLPGVTETMAEKLIAHGYESLVEISTAGLDILKQVDGIGDTRAQEILDWISQHPAESLKEAVEATFQELWAKYGVVAAPVDPLQAKLAAEFAREKEVHQAAARTAADRAADRERIFGPAGAEPPPPPPGPPGGPAGVTKEEEDAVRRKLLGETADKGAS
ncbi:MAG: transcription termination factor NusA [Planctomycetes bacterium]|nr:transcription termination factor NusA [Planctomycetota bacterium]